MVPEVLICDEGPHFTSSEFRKFVHTMGVKDLNVVPPKAHFSNGKAEAAIKKINNVLKFYSMNGMSDWDERLPVLLHIINKSKSTYRVPPMDILYGVRAPAPGALRPQKNDDKGTEKEENVIMQDMEEENSTCHH